MTGRKQSSLIAIGLIAAAVAASPIRAQPVSDDAESLISASAAVDTGMALARRQAAQNDLLGAAATVERVLIGNPDSVAPRLLYAGLLCRLGDPAGAAVELALLGRQTVVDEDWAEFTRSCGTMARRAPGR